MTTATFPPAPYVGVAGFMTQDEVRAVLASIDPEPPRKLAVGVLASRKTLFDGGNRYPLRYPKSGRIAGIFVDDPRCLNLVHYAQDDSAGLGLALVKAYELGGSFCHGVQVNVPWPDREQLQIFTATFPGARVVLQIGPKAIGDNPYLVWRNLFQYAWTITDVLVDGSGGEGKAVDLEMAARLVNQLRTLAPHLGVGAAGGFDGESIGGFAPVLQTIPRVSVDAEGRVRDGSPMGGVLVVDKARAYVRRAMQIVGDVA